MKHTLMNLGSGPRSVLEACADSPWVHEWEEIRIDVEPACKPDIVASLLDLGDIVAENSADVIICSHVLEHLYDHEVGQVLSEIFRILKPDGAVVIKTPDLLQVAEVLLRDDLEGTVYDAPAGEITILDVLYGHRSSIEAGDTYMAHHTGFTEQSMARKLLDAGFEEVATEHGASVDFVAIAYSGPRPFTTVIDRLIQKC